VDSNLDLNSNLNQIVYGVKIIGKTCLPLLGPATSLSACYRFRPMRGPFADCQPAGHIILCLGRCQAGPTCQAATSHLSSISLSPLFPFFFLTSRCCHGKAGHAAELAAAGCLHTSRARSSRPPYLPPSIRAAAGASPRTLANWEFAPCPCRR
jgi:hypothetical protein